MSAKPDLNGFAAISGTHHLIGTTVGAVLNLNRLFYLLLSHGAVLPAIGPPGSAPEWFDSFEGCNWLSANSEVTPHLKPASARMPSQLDPIRRTAAEFLWTFALDFLFFHELAHHLLGHLGYLASRHALSGLSETDAPGSDAVADRHAIELEADGFAAQALISTWLRKDSAEGTVFDNDDEPIMLGSFAIGVLFLVFAGSPRSLSAHRGAPHPHPAVRFRSAFDTILSVAKSHSTQAWTKADRAWTAAMHSLDHTGRFFGQRQPAALHSLDHGFDEVEEAFLSVGRHLQKIRPGMSTYRQL
jgi:hypothetical protein